jgi:hypothetical protein
VRSPPTRRADVITGRKGRIPLIVALLLVVAAASLAQTPTGHAMLRQAGLEAPAPAYTALSFARPQSLPGRLTARRTTVRVPFTVRNDSSGIRSYRYSLTASRAGNEGSLTARPVSRTITVVPGASITLDPALSLVCDTGQIRITIRLAQPAESIDFLTRCPNSPK